MARPDGPIQSGRRGHVIGIGKFAPLGLPNEPIGKSLPNHVTVSAPIAFFVWFRFGSATRSCSFSFKELTAPSANLEREDG